MAEEFTKVLHIQGDAVGAIGAIRQVRQENAQLVAEVEAANAKMAAAAAAKDAAMTRGASQYLGRENAESQARRDAADTAEAARMLGVENRRSSVFGTMGDIERTGQAPNRIRSFMDRLANIGRTSVGSIFGGEMDKAAAAADRAGKAVEGAGESASRARPKLGALANAASLIAPEFGAVISLAHTLRGALMALATGPGAIIAAIAAAIGLLVVAFKNATAAAAEFRAESERLRQGGVERERDVSKSLAKAGVPLQVVDASGNKVSTVNRAAARIRTLEDAGFTREEAMPLAPSLAVPEGMPGAITDEEAKLLAVAQQMQGAPPISTVPGMSPERRIAGLRAFVDRSKGAVQAGVDQIQAAEARHLRAAAEGSEIDIAQELVRRYGYTPEKAAKEASEIRREIKEPKPRGLEWRGTSWSDAAEGGGEIRTADQGEAVIRDLMSRSGAAVAAMEQAEKRSGGSTASPAASQPVVNVTVPAPVIQIQNNVRGLETRVPRFLAY